MKKFLLLIILFFVVITCGCTKTEPKSSFDEIKERGTLVVGVKYDSKPFGYVENGELKGFDIDIAKKIAKNIFGDENKVEFIEVTADNRISKLMEESIDIVVATMTDTEQRRLVVDFSIPYYTSGQAVMCKKNSHVSSIADLSNHSAVVVRGSTAEKTLRSLYRRSNIILANNYKEAFNNVTSVENSCLIADEVILKGFVSDNPSYFIFNKKLTVENYAVALRQDEEKLKKIVDYTINQLKNSGELENLTRKWIK